MRCSQTRRCGFPFCLERRPGGEGAASPRGLLLLWILNGVDAVATASWVHLGLAAELNPLSTFSIDVDRASYGNVRRFIDEGDKVKVTLRFRGREMAHQELGAKMLKRVEKDMADEIVVEQWPKMEGRQMVMLISPKKV